MRYRDLETGSFITPDPLGFVNGPNRYTYVRQNPWTRFDPEGLEWKTAKDATLKNARDDAFSYAGGVLNGSVNASQKISNAVMHPGETAKSALIGTLGALVNASVAAQAITSGEFGALGQAATNAGKESIASVKDTVSDPGKLGNAVGETAINTLAAAATAEIGGAAVGALKKGVGALQTVEEAGSIAAKNADKVFSKEKQALVDMAKTDKKTGMTKADMDAYKQLNKEVPDPFPANKVRGPEAHPSRSPHSQKPHGHVGPVDHIPITDAN